MRGSIMSTSSTPEIKSLARWSVRALACAVFVGVMALAFGTAASKSSQASTLLTFSALNHANSGAGNRVPLW